MNKSRVGLVVFVIIGSVAAVMLGRHFALSTAQPVTDVVVTPAAAAPVKVQVKKGPALKPRVKGDPNAPLKIVEFMDFQCPSCAKGATLIQKYLTKFPDDIFLQIKYFPLKGHKHSIPATEVIDCAREQGVFWKVANAIMTTQKDWREEEEALPFFMVIADDAGLDLVKLDACIANPATRERIMSDRKEAQSMGLKATPTFFMNGEMVVGFKAIKAKLEEKFGVLEPEAESPQPPAPKAE